MQTNRSMPPGQVIPELAYEDVRAAAAWLCTAFGFSERLRIGDHRAQLRFGSGSLVVVDGAAPAQTPGPLGHAVMIRVDNVDQHFAQAQKAGARILRPPTTYPYGERQYTALDPAGHCWTFSQSVADVHPAEWGGTLLEDA